MDTRRPQQPNTASPEPQGTTPSTGSPMSVASPKPQGTTAAGGSQMSGSGSPRPDSGGRQQGARRSAASQATLQPSMSEDPLDAARTLASEATSVAESLSSDLHQAVKATTRAAKAQASELGADVGHEL